MKLFLVSIAIAFILFGLLLFACVKAAGDYTRDEEMEDEKK